MSEIKALKKIIAAWESLPTGNHSPSAIEKWLRDKMKPAIDAGRKALARPPTTGGEHG